MATFEYIRGGFMSLSQDQHMSIEPRSEINDTNIFSVIKNRRATRSFLSKPVSDEIINELIDYANQAPSAMNLQPWSFVVIQNSDLLKEISLEVKKKLLSNPFFSKDKGEYGVNFLTDPKFDIFHGASSLVIFCAKENVQKEFNTESDCFLAAQNFMLAATGLGLSTCPIGLATDLLGEPLMRGRLGIPSDSKPVLPIIVGYAEGKTHFIGRNPPTIKWVK